MRTFCCLFLFCLCSLSISAQAQLAVKKTLQCSRIDEKIQIDGKLEEAAWLQASPATDFIVMWPNPGKAAKEKTVVKVLYDDAAIYVSAYCYDPNPDSIFHRITKRDELENSDDFAVVIDAYRDGQNAVQFGVSPDNVQFDSKYSLSNANPNNGDQDGEDGSWDAVWKSAAKITADGWTVEIEIPYSALRFPKKAVQDWGVNFYRSVKRRNETDSWNEVKAEISGTLSQMGILTGIENIKAPLRLSATPFVAAYANNSYNQTGADKSSWSYPYSFGMDLKYGINEAFTLDATLIPDFGQVRSDQKVLNLSPFEVKFDENRPFFTEGTELFNKGGLFYSRRIGAQAQLLNATKISGRTKKGLGIGVFNAIEAAEYETVVKEGQEVRETVSPLTNNSILVLDQNLKNNSSVTFITTNVLRSGSATDANVSGVLFSLKNKAQSYALAGKAVMSNRMDPDATERGYTASFDLTKTSGKILWGLSGNLESDQYNPNDLGFLFSPNELSMLGYVNYNRYKPWWKLNNFWVSAWHWEGALYKPVGEWTERIFGFNFGGNTKKFHNFGVNMNFNPWGERDFFEPRTFDFEHYYRQPVNTNYHFWYNSDNRKKITIHVDGGLRKFNEKGRKSTNVYVGPRWRVSDKFTVGCGVGNELAWNNVGGIDPENLNPDAIGFDALPASPIVMGRRKVVGFDNQLNATYSFNTKMNITMYARHYWQKVTYSEFYTLDEQGNLAPTPYTGHTLDQVSVHDIAANFFNVDCVFTWRFAPGSDLLVVYKNGVGHFEDGVNVSHDYFYNVKHLPDYEGNNNISVKLLYYLDYDHVKKMF